MGKIYIEQTDLTLNFNAGKALNAGDICIIEYISPQFVKGTFNAVITNAPLGLVSFNVNNTTSEFMALGAGTYRFWLKITDIISGLVSIGEPCDIMINTKGS